MSGEKFNKYIDRRNFLKLSGLFLSIPLLNACRFFSPNYTFPVTIVGANSKTGHLLRENKFPAPVKTIIENTIIVGGGISGLSAARWLKKNNFHDFKLFELDTKTGGNSKSGENRISKYPFAAHYLPIPNENFPELIEFLHEHKIITGFDFSGLPLYDEYFICFEPQERFFYRGIWHDGLPPKSGLNESEVLEINRFSEITENYKNKIGKDNKPAFTIPLELSSTDEEFLSLDKITIAEYLRNNEFKSDFLGWYLNYCCKDDFGSTIENTSAWAAIHYFASRNGKAANALSSDVLVWPEGNQFLAAKLEKEISNHLKTEYLTYRVERYGNQWNCFVYDVKNKESIKYVCQNIILASPQFVNKKILAFDTGIDFNTLNYYPWLVANISIKNKKSLNGAEDLCWDNVLYSSKSLGYVNACHQSIDSSKSETVITYYYNFSESDPKTERESIYSKDDNYWKEFIVNDLKKAHPKIEESITEIEINILGHGMISPSKNFRSEPSRKILEAGFDNLYFAHSDVSGISIFEQAFYRGIAAAKQLLKNRTHDKL
ncbi:MAG: NAD(P)-binding protein [Bacteroidetes bacterium]|nr:NAD(P)-binding protein [Bacteroidota bacterium]